MTSQNFAVAIPARDEARLLPFLLQSLVAQDIGWNDGHVFVVANNCTDETVRVAMGFVSELPITVIDVSLPPDQAHVGTARKLALDAACAWVEDRCSSGALLCTDADAFVATDWVRSNLASLVRSDLVGGRLLTMNEDKNRSRLHEAIDAYWRCVRAADSAIDPQDHDLPPRHGDHTGASLAFSATLYRRLGGLTALPTREDVDFVSRAVCAGARLSHPAQVSVHVSTRTIGRASGGMAVEMMRRHAIAGRPDDYQLPHPADWIEVSHARRRLRDAWRTGSEVSRALAHESIGEREMDGILHDCPNDIAFVERASLKMQFAKRPEIGVLAAIDLFHALEADRISLAPVA